MTEINHLLQIVLDTNIEKQWGFYEFSQELRFFVVFSFSSTTQGLDPSGFFRSLRALLYNQYESFFKFGHIYIVSDGS